MGKKIAILTPCYNVHPDLIHKHFYSIQRQGHVIKDVLHVVVDDCSTDKDTRAALLYNADNNKDHTLLVARHNNGGPGAARNKALEFVNRVKDIEYVCLLDADDYLEEDSLQLRRNVLDETDVVAVYGNKYTAKWALSKDEVIDGKPLLTEVSKQLEQVPEYDKARLFRECYIPSCSIMFRLTAFNAYIKQFREDVRLCEDWLVWRKLALLGRMKKINIPTYTQTLHGSNLTTNAAVLKNHLKDMVTTKGDLDQWINDNMAHITL